MVVRDPDRSKLRRDCVRVHFDAQPLLNRVPSALAASRDRMRVVIPTPRPAK
jgi:hypothetical protein